MHQGLRDLVNEKRNSQAMRILIADDESLARRLIVKMFRTDGWIVSEVSSAEQALSLWQRGQFDVVLTDYLMPGMNGIALAKRIRTDEVRQLSARSVRLILLSGSVHVAAFGMSLTQGLFDVVLAKPASFNVIRRAANGESSHEYR